MVRAGWGLTEGRVTEPDGGVVLPDPSDGGVGGAVCATGQVCRVPAVNGHLLVPTLHYGRLW